MNRIIIVENYGHFFLNFFKFLITFLEFVSNIRAEYMTLNYVMIQIINNLKSCLVKINKKLI